MNYVSIETIKARNRAAGRYYFEPATMRFFRSRTAQYGFEAANGDIYFVTSEQFDYRSPRLYSVRKMTPDGEISTVGEFQQYASRCGATKAAQRLAA